MTTHYFKKNNSFLVVQWLRTCLPVQGTWVLSLVWEDATSHGQLSLCAETTEPKLLSARNHHQEPPPGEAAARESLGSKDPVQPKRFLKKVQLNHVC